MTSGIFSVFHLTVFAGLNARTELLDFIEPRFWVFYLHIALKLFFMIFLICKQVRTIPAYGLKNFPNVVQEIYVVNWLFKLYVSKMSRAVNLSAHTRFAMAITVHRSHKVIVDAVGYWVSVCVVC